MNRTAVVVAALFVCMVGFPARISSSAWTSLFNGKDLAGWKQNGQEKWGVENGTIVCESTANKYGYLTSEKTYRNFDLRLKFKPEAAGNSGVFLRSKIIGVDPEHGPDIEGLQVEVDPSVGKHTGGLYESGGRGWVAMPTEAGEKALNPGEWNELQVSAHSNHVVTQVNGVKIVDFTDSAQKFSEGVIGLQIHTGGGVKMRWKEIYIREQ
ncbi:MAG TPA: DUF1080 domain-containing protein [Candidatus Eisenbacteria bacterium]|jgi:hypothetical protein|nr:DUF1080 domain-containing protein [Candidatus Eisenbacteria bacterium]